MKSDRQRRNFWMGSEIDMMLQLIEDIQRKHGCTSTTHSTFLQIANKMKKLGFTNKSAMQIRRKWFQMKSAYLCYKRGNYERITLIPEEFRDKVAKFVEAERKFCHIKLEKELYNNNSFKVAANVKHESMNNELPIPRASTPKTKMETRSNKKQKQIKSMNNDTTSTQCSSDKVQMQEFVNATREMQKVLLNDFKRMQERVLNYQAKCQKIRANNVRAFFETNVFDTKSFL